MNYSQFKKTILVKNLTDKNGNPKHTRLVKRLFYKFATELKNEYGFDMFRCDNDKCRITEWNGQPIIMELNHLNRVTNDSRIKNLQMLCPNCHQQTDGYKNRSISIDEHYNKLVTGK